MTKRRSVEAIVVRGDEATKGRGDGGNLAPSPLQGEGRGEGRDWKSNLNPYSLEVLPTCYVEPSLKDAAPGHRVQFERLGYFCIDPDSTSEKLVFNRTVTLKDAWARIKK